MIWRIDGRRAGDLILVWADIYTRGLPPRIAKPRREELASDVFEHAALAGDSEVARRRIAREMIFRAVRGMGADIFWRSQQRRQLALRRAGLPPTGLQEPVTLGLAAGGVGGGQDLLAIVNEALVTARSAENLLDSMKVRRSASSADARTGLHLRLAFMKLNGSLVQIPYTPEQAALREDAAALLTYYLHLITRTFQVRFSPLALEEQDTLTRGAKVQRTAYERLNELRDDLQGSLTVPTK